MRRTNYRFILTGLLMLLIAGGFFIWMLDLAPKSNDPKELLRIAGMASGAVGGIGLVLIFLGAVGTKRR